MANINIHIKNNTSITTYIFFKQSLETQAGNELHNSDLLVTVYTVSGGQSKSCSDAMNYFT